MRLRRVSSVALAVALLVSVAGLAGAGPGGSGFTKGRFSTRSEHPAQKGFVPAVAAPTGIGRYFVVMKGPAAAQTFLARRSAGGRVSGAEERRARNDALRLQEGAIGEARSLGGKVVFRYGTLVNAFSARLSPRAVSALGRRADIASVQPVSIVVRQNESSVPFIGAPKVWKKFGARGQGMTLALVDTGIDYTHKDFGGPGTVAAYENNNPNYVEPGTFPTKKVIGGYDFVGSNYDVLDDDPTNDTPRPDFDPLDRDGHGTHTGGTCCGIGVPGKVGAGVAPKVKILSYKVWDVGNSTDDVLVAAYERAVDPNQDGNTRDHADVLSFSGGVDYGTLNSVEAVAAQRVVGIGTVFVASAGNSGNQPSGASAYITGTPANARGVISVAASIDQYYASHLVVNSPSITLPQGGLMFVQDWGASLPSGGQTTNLFDGRAVDPANPVPGDRMFCDPVPANSLTGKFVVVYKGSTGAGDCAGSDKVGNAEAAGATGVVLVSIFSSGQPSALGGDQRGIPAVFIGRDDGDAILDALSPNAPTTYNEQTVNVTLDPSTVNFPQFADAMTDFTSEGPARVTNDLKPDISAPGFSITSAGVGTGDDAAVLSGTSMAAPHVSGVAVLLRQLHPNWDPGRIKSLIMNQAQINMKNSDLSSPVPATDMGAGRVRAFRSATARSLTSKGSLSFGLRFLSEQKSLVRSFRVDNFDGVGHDYHVSAGVRYSDFDPSIASLGISLNGTSFGATRSFHVGAHAGRRVWVRLGLDPSVISALEQEFGWYYFHPNVDGTVTIQQDAPHASTMRVPWHVAPLAASDDSLSKSSLDLTGGPATMTMNGGSAAGQSYADLYLLGATDPVASTGEEDIVATGARSFTGPTINNTPQGVPTGTDPLGGITWQQFLSNDNAPTDPVEFGVQTAGVHNTTETLEVDVKVDTGADGVFADPNLQADYLVVKGTGAGGVVCVFDLSLANPFDQCAETYFADYSNYNANVVGLVVDAQAIGLSTGTAKLSYQVTACTGRFSGDVPGTFCDTAGDFDSDTGTYTSQLNATNPALDIDPLVCRGFWSGGDCNGADPITVATGSAAPGDDPSILAIFPNNAPSRTPTVVTTTT